MDHFILGNGHEKGLAFDVGELMEKLQQPKDRRGHETGCVDWLA